MKKLLTCIIGIGLTGALAFAAVVSPPAAPSVSAGGNSFNPVFSADGQKLVFVSHANNLVTNDDHGLWLDVFVRDLMSSNTVLVSVSTNGTGGANSDANYPSLSADGRYIAFSSYASNLAPDTTNGLLNVFVRDTVLHTTRVVTVDTNGFPAYGGPAPLISSSGRYIFFASGASMLTPESVNSGDIHLYRRDLWSNVTVRASDNSVSGAPFLRPELGSITPDGAFCAYSSRTNPSPNTDVFRHQVGFSTAWLSMNVAGVITGAYRCSAPVMSDDGRYAAFYATPLNGSNTLALHHDTQTSTTLVISSLATNLTHGLQISADGQRVLFEYMDGIYARPAIWENTLGGIIAPILCNGLDLRGNPAMTPTASGVAYIGCSNVYYAGPTNLLVSASTNGSFSSGDYQFVTPAISPDGARVAFAVTANDLVTGDLNGQSDIFLRDVTTGVTELITKTAPSKPATTAFAHSFLGPTSVSADGRLIVSTRYDDPSAWRDTNGALDIFLTDKLLGTSHALSVDNNLFDPSQGGGSGGVPFYPDNTNSYSGPIISADGTTVAALRAKAIGFDIVWTRSSNNVFGTGLFTAYRTRNPGGSLFGNGSSYAPSLSSDGRELAFTTTSTDFVFTNGTDNNGFSDVVLSRTAESNGLIYSANYLVSVTPGGVSGNNFSSNAVISPDGRWVIFESLATDLVPGTPTGYLLLYARDLWSNTTHWVNRPKPPVSPGHVWPGRARFSGNSRRIAYIDGSEGQTLAMHDLHARTNAYSTAYFSPDNPAVDFEGQRVVYINTALPPGPYIKHAYLWNTYANTIAPVSVGPNGGLANGMVGSPLISADGRYVVFSSWANNLSSFDTGRLNDLFVRDRLLGTTLIVSANAGGGAGNGPSTKPVLAANGRTVVFQSFASDLVAGDFNDKRDLFVLTLGGVDSEPDGMDDDWEMAYFETLSRDGSLDWDNDGATDLAEFLAGTDPKNNGSIFRVLTVAPAGGGTKTLFWSGNPTRSYRAEFKDDLGATSWTALTGTISWNGTTASLTDPTAGSATNRFYRVLRLP